MVSVVVAVVVGVVAVIERVVDGAVGVIAPIAVPTRSSKPCTAAAITSTL